MATIRQPLTGVTTYESPLRSVRFDWIMAFVSIWWMGGLFVDAWAHSNVPQLETFFTPWHAVLYSGFLAVAATLVIKTIRNWKLAAPGDMASGAPPSLVTCISNTGRGLSFLESVPAGYELSLLGVGIFAVSGVGDLTWHLLFGIERSVDALLSPTHLGLALGVGLALSGPLRAAWRRRESRHIVLAPTGSRHRLAHLYPLAPDILYGIRFPPCQSLADLPRECISREWEDYPHECFRSCWACSGDN